jgi:hypothetical protein
MTVPRLFSAIAIINPNFFLRMHKECELIGPKDISTSCIYKT